MKPTILFDLDDTLLKNEMGIFLPAYFSLIHEIFSGSFPESDVLAAVLSASQDMLASLRPDSTLIEVFFAHVTQATGLTTDEMQPVIDRFYRDHYPSLRSLTGPVEGAAGAVAAVRRKGFRMAVATNPLFPEVAIRMRLKWAELGVDPTAFELVTSQNTFHFAKPFPEFYAEVLSKMGWPEGPILMVGNDPINDIQGASDLGLATYIVNESNRPFLKSDRQPAAGAGDLDRLPELLVPDAFSALMPDYTSPSAIRAIMRSTPAFFHSFLNCPEADWAARNEGEWSAEEVLQHLRDVEARVHLPRIRMFLEEDNPFIQGVDTDAWHAEGFPPADRTALFEDFLRLRMEGLVILDGLEASQWGLPARHAIFGPTDLLEIAKIMAGHDQLHVRQVHSLLAAKAG